MFLLGIGTLLISILTYLHQQQDVNLDLPCAGRRELVVQWSALAL